MNNLASVTRLVQDEIGDVEKRMRAQAHGFHPDLDAALELIFKSGGKRIRPTLTLLVGHALGGPREKLVILSSAIELLHTATLVHDDLIDGSLLRRGMPTLNSQWSPGATVLTGDFLFACAANLASETNSIPVIDRFSQTLITIVSGEINQLFSSRFAVNRDEYDRRIYAKTASLFETSTTTAAMISGVDQAVVDSMTIFGRNIGMAFQIIDDILDFTGDQATLGKPIGSDLHQGLITLPALIYLGLYPDQEVVRKIKSGVDPTPDQLANLIELIRASNVISTAHTEAKKYVLAANQALNVLPASPERDALKGLAEYIVDRNL